MENADCRASCALIVSVFIFICRFLLLLFSVFLLQQIICQSWLLSFCHVWQSGLLRRSLSGEYVCPAGLEPGSFGVSGIGGQAAVTVSAFAVKRRTGRLSAFPFSRCPVGAVSSSGFPDVLEFGLFDVRLGVGQADMKALPVLGRGFKHRIGHDGLAYRTQAASSQFELDGLVHDVVEYIVVEGQFDAVEFEEFLASP